MSLPSFFGATFSPSVPVSLLYTGDVLEYKLKESGADGIVVVAVQIELTCRETTGTCYNA